MAEAVIGVSAVWLAQVACNRACRRGLFLELRQDKESGNYDKYYKNITNYCIIAVLFFGRQLELLIENVYHKPDQLSFIPHIPCYPGNIGCARDGYSSSACLN